MHRVFFSWAYHFFSEIYRGHRICGRVHSSPSSPQKKEKNRNHIFQFSNQGVHYLGTAKLCTFIPKCVMHEVY